MRLNCYKMFFFFSSRRRHTRYWRDWSSDVCSSDLTLLAAQAVTIDHLSRGRLQLGLGAGGMAGDYAVLGLDTWPLKKRRSEERRVGKECRSRGWPDH